jgi:hypothetical protein
MAIAVDSSNIDEALLAVLANDATLRSLMPDGVFLNEARPGAKRFVLVTVEDADDRARFGGRAYEEVRYLVKAVGFATLNPNMKAAAFRIDQLLEDMPLTVPGYTHMVMSREGRIPPATEVDDIDPSLRWYHWGGRYRVMQAIPQAGG